MSALAVLVTDDVHYAAVSQEDGSAAVIPDPESGRDARSNDVSLRGETAWTGTRAEAAALAGISPPPYDFVTCDLRNFQAPVIDDDTLKLSAEGCLALLLRKAISDSQSYRASFEKVVVALDIDLAATDASALEAFLSDVLQMNVFVCSMDWALRHFLSTCKSSKVDRGMIAFLNDRVVLGRFDGARAHIARLRDHSGLLTLKRDIDDRSQPGGTMSAWSRRHVWREFLRWFKTPGQSSDASSAPFSPYLLDHRLRRRSLSRALAEASVKKLFVAMTGGFAVANELPAGSDLYLVGDDALKLGLREAASVANVSKKQHLVETALHKIAVAMTTCDIDRRSVESTELAYGLLLRERPGLPKRFVPVVPAGHALPAVRDTTLQVTAGQSRVKCDLAAQLDAEPPRLLRQLWFDVESAQTIVGGIRVQLHVSNTRRLTVGAHEAVSGKPLAFVESRVPAGNGVDLSGPETIARVSIAGTPR